MSLFRQVGLLALMNHLLKRMRERTSIRPKVSYTIVKTPQKVTWGSNLAGISKSWAWATISMRSNPTEIGHYDKSAYHPSLNSKKHAVGALRVVRHPSSSVGQGLVLNYWWTRQTMPRTRVTTWPHHRQSQCREVRLLDEDKINEDVQISVVSQSLTRRKALLYARYFKSTNRIFNSSCTRILRDCDTCGDLMWDIKSLRQMFTPTVEPLSVMTSDFTSPGVEVLTGRWVTCMLLRRPLRMCSLKPLHVLYGWGFTMDQGFPTFFVGVPLDLYYILW